MIESQEKFEKLRDALRAGQFADDPELEMALAMEAKAWKEQHPSATKQPKLRGSIADPLGQGALFGFSDEIAGALGAGVNSALNLFGKGTGESFGQAYQGIRDVARENLGEYRERKPVTSTVAELGGAVATGIGAAPLGALKAATGAGRVGLGAALGAGQGATYGLGASEASTAKGLLEDTAGGALIGGATGAAFPAIGEGLKAGGRAIFKPAVINNKLYRAAVRQLDDAGVDLTTGQKTGSNAIKGTEETFADTLVGGKIRQTLDRGRQQLQSKLMKMAGFANKDVTEGLMSRQAVDRAAKKYTRRYTKALAGKTLDLSDDKFINKLAQVESNHMELMPFQQRNEIRSIVGQLLDEATNGPMDAFKYQKIRSTLGQRERSFANTPILESLYRDMKHALDDAFADKAKLGIDRDYSRFVKLRDLQKRVGGPEASMGIMPLASLARLTSKGDREFDALVRAGSMVLGDRVPNSGTVTRGINAFLLGQAPVTAAMGGVDAGLLSIGLPVGVSQALGRGVTSGPANLVSSGGLLAPAVVAGVNRLEE